MTAKDQSYFPARRRPASALSKTLFPIGELHKAEVRQLAHAAGLPVYDKPDSTGICFIGERPFQEFLSRYLRTEPGPIETADGAVLGEHRGLALYTLGQRSGLRLGGRAGAAAAPWYVADKDHGAQRAHRGAGSGPSAAAVRCLRRRTDALAECPRRRGRADRVRGQDALSAERSRLACAARERR